MCVNPFFNNVYSNSSKLTQFAITAQNIQQNIVYNKAAQSTRSSIIANVHFLSQSSLCLNY